MVVNFNELGDCIAPRLYTHISASILDGPLQAYLMVQAAQRTVKCALDGQSVTAPSSHNLRLCFTALSICHAMHCVELGV